MEQFKNLMQIMIWMHNRYDVKGLEDVRNEIASSLTHGRITPNMYKTLMDAWAEFIYDCREYMKKEEETVNASMA